MRLFLGFIMLAFVAGCATTQKPSAVTELQIKVSQLENKLEDKDREVSDLKDELSALSSQLEGMDSGSASSLAVEEPLADVSSSKSDNSEIIRVGVSAEEVQRALKAAGYYDGTVDGKLGKKTKQGIQQFQKDHNLKADGVIGKKTWSELKVYLK